MIDTIINLANGPSVQDCFRKVSSLRPDYFTQLVKEFKSHPDIRFGDNLLMALSLMV